MARARVEHVVGAVVEQSISVPGGTVMDMAKGIASETTQMVIGSLASGSIDISHIGLLSIIANIGGLMWKANAFLHHRRTVQSLLAACLQEYRETGYLAMSRRERNTYAAVWRTTRAFRDSKMVLDLYPDIKQYLQEEKFTEAELRAIGLYTEVAVHADSKRFVDIKQRLSTACRRAGIRDITETDAETRISNVSYVHMGAIAFENACIAEGQKRERGETPRVVPVLGRILGIVALCGLTEISVSEITTILGKAPIFETVARARIAKFRNQHASQVFNTLLFKGSTEGAARRFSELAPDFKGDCVVVGRVCAAKKSEFLDGYTPFRCKLDGPEDRRHAVGKPIYMLAGWANLISRREPESINQEHSGRTRRVRFNDNVKFKRQDIHGNIYPNAGKTGYIVFKVKELPDGSLMAKPRHFDRFDYKSRADYNQGHNRVEAMGEEKLFGGIIGPAVCSCRGVADRRNKGQITKNWRLGQALKVTSRTDVRNSITHTKKMSTKEIAILWRPGDWAMGCFFMQTLPQSSYLQGRRECLYCAVESAALAGCPEVIACGGGRIDADTFEMDDQKAEVTGAHPTLAREDPPTRSPRSSWSMPRRDSTITPPPAYTREPGSPRLGREHFFATSDARRKRDVPGEEAMSAGGRRGSFHRTREAGPEIRGYNGDFPSQRAAAYR